MSIKCVTLWVRDTWTWSPSIINSGIWKSILTPTYSTKIIIGEPRCHNSINPVCKFLCLAIFYLPEIRSSASPYLVQSCSWQVLFTRSAIQYHPMIKLLSHVFANGVWYWLTSGPGVYLSDIGGTNPNLDTCNPTSTFRLPERNLYDHPFIVWRLMTSKLSSSTREWHYLMV
jgi:hypothetical protein